MTSLTRALRHTFVVLLLSMVFVGCGSEPPPTSNPTNDESSPLDDSEAEAEAGPAFELIGVWVGHNDTRGEDYCHVAGVWVAGDVLRIAEDQSMACPPEGEDGDDLTAVRFDDLESHEVAPRWAAYLRSVLGDGSTTELGDAQHTQDPVNQQRRITLRLTRGDVVTTRAGRFLQSAAVPGGAAGREAASLMEAWEALRRPGLYRPAPSAPRGRPTEPEYVMGHRVFPYDPCGQCAWQSHDGPPALDDPNPPTAPSPPGCGRALLPSDPPGVPVRAGCHPACCPAR